MKIIAIVYFILYLIQFFIEPFVFGIDKGEYNPSNWLVKIVITAPLMYLLYVVGMGV